MTLLSLPNKEIIMAHTKDVERKLRTLPLGEYKLLEIIKIIIDADQYQQEGLFNKGPYGRIVNTHFNDNFYTEDITAQFKSFFPKGLEDLWVDITYQRLLKLKKIVEHLKREDRRGHYLNFNRMLAGSIDIVVRPNGKGFVWDGFRRSILALLNGVRFVKTSIEEHDSSMSIEDCKAEEAFVYTVKSGKCETMKKEELFKSGVVSGDVSSLKMLKVIQEMEVDVLGTNPGHPELGAFSEFQDTVIREKLDTIDYLVQSSFKMQKSWSDADTLTGYVLCGLAKFLDIHNKEDDDGERIIKTFEFHTAHPNSKKTCDVEEALVAYAGRKVDKNGVVMYNHSQTDLCANRLAGKSIESVAFAIGKLVMKLDKTQISELLYALGFEEGDMDTLNFTTINNTSTKALST